jgi:hypothetical protein
MAYRQSFLDALKLIAAAIETMAEMGLRRPVLVGGAAVELWTSSAVTSGDFDFVTENLEIFEKLLIEQGFSKPGGRNVLLRGLEHRELEIGVEVVSGPLFDGAVPEDRIVAISYETGTLNVISVEDAIADRMGQYAAHEASGGEMLDQAVTMLRIAEEIDKSYLDRRIREETLNSYGLDFLERQTVKHEDPGTAGP